MIEQRTTYDFCGAGLLLEAGAETAALFARGFGSFAVPSQGFEQPAFTLRIATQPAAVPDDLPPVWTGALPEGGHGRLFETQDRCVLEVIDACILDIQPKERRAVVSLAAGGGWRFMGSASMLLIDFILSAGGQRLVHAACLTRPSTGGAILIHGASGRGKTTTSIALARGGFGLMTDDASVIGFTADSSRAWGLPRALKVHRRTAELMPWLRPLLGRDWDESGEQGVSLRDIGEHARIVGPSPRELEAILVLGDRNAGGHRIERISKGDALIEIALDNLAWFDAGAPERSATMFDVLGRALAAVPTYRLNAGPDLDTLPSVLEGALERGPVLLGAR